ncbi:unnamed protein product [Gongylonema pulchrum]|uniref:Uncharacterized protein n=1 Tax=Gongylonema pulchrum TaxID=637853 RepID=A0A3P7MQ32_9BILA|nr:unnamed protein product [Gongylonema pulchrum]
MQPTVRSWSGEAPSDAIVRPNHPPVSDPRLSVTSDPRVPHVSDPRLALPGDPRFPSAEGLSKRTAPVKDIAAKESVANVTVTGTPPSRAAERRVPGPEYQTRFCAAGELEAVNDGSSDQKFTVCTSAQFCSSWGPDFQYFHEFHRSNAERELSRAVKEVKKPEIRDLSITLNEDEDDATAFVAAADELAELTKGFDVDERDSRLSLSEAVRGCSSVTSRKAEDSNEASSLQKSAVEPEVAPELTSQISGLGFVIVPVHRDYLGLLFSDDIYEGGLPGLQQECVPSNVRLLMVLRRKNATLVVVGDIGRSPRMCYHAKSLADKNYHVQIVGYADSVMHPVIEQHPLIRYYSML